VSSPQAGWYADPEDASHLRYWDGSSWTDHRAPTPPPGQYARYTADVYDERADLGQLLTEEQREQYKQHALTSFPTWLVVVLHFLTLSLFTLIYQGLKFSKLPEAKQDDFRAGKAIGFMFIPFFNWYWQFRFALGLTDRLNFQFRLRGKRPPVSRGLALASAIVLLIPYVGLISWLILMPIVAGQWQSATNRLAAEREAGLWAGLPAPSAALPPSAPQG
jgi:Protein of unknown function (DUF2510)